MPLWHPSNTGHVCWPVGLADLGHAESRLYLRLFVLLVNLHGPISGGGGRRRERWGRGRAVVPMTDKGSRETKKKSDRETRTVEVHSILQNTDPK